MEVPGGDPAAMHQVAVRLRLLGQEMAVVFATAQDWTTLPALRGGFVDRFREAMSQRRERGGRLERRLEILAEELDRAAAWLEHAQREARLANEMSGRGLVS